MVRPRPVLNVLALGLLLTGIAAGQDAPKAPAPAPAPVAAPATTPEAGPIEGLPYRIRVLLAAEPSARLDAARRERLLADWRDEVARFVGAPWRLDVAEAKVAAPRVLGGELDEADAAKVGPLADGFEKAWLIRVAGEGSGYRIDGREYDAATRRLGPVLVREAAVARDLPRALLRFSLDLFAPVATIGARFGKEATLAVRGSALPAATEAGRVVRVGTVFQPFRVVPVKDGPEVVREIPFTYLRVESADGPETRSTFLSMFSDPFTGRVVQRTRLIALGVRPGGRPTRLRFLTLPDRAPAAGYALTARSVPDGLPRAAGLTDRDGRITLPARFSEGLEVFRLLAGGDEPMREFPLMPGTSADELVVPPFDPKPGAVALATRVESLRDRVIDLVAVRARLEARLKARFDGEDWAGAEATLAEANALPRKETFVDALNQIKDEAARRQTAEKTPILTRNAQARLAELQGLIERYLDDEVFKGFAEGLAKQKSADAAAAKKKAAPRP